MKVQFGPGCFWDYSAPILRAELVAEDGVRRYRVFCPHCNDWHYHGPGNGHRFAHCYDPDSPFERTGYNLALNLGFKCD